MKYTIAVSGWVQVEIDADTPEKAIEEALTDSVAGELSDYEIDSVIDEKGKNVEWDYDEVDV